MIISVAKLKEFINCSDVSDHVLEARLQALETSIRNKTNNKFQDVRYRTTGCIKNGIVEPSQMLFNVGDTITVNDDLCVIHKVSDGKFVTETPLNDANNVLITKVVYPQDVVMGVVNVMEWILTNPSQKAGISSETLSRHSVTYSGHTEFDADMGCPIRLTSFLNTYKKARF